MVLSQVLLKLRLRKSNFTDVALCDVESVDGLEVDGEHAGGAKLLTTVTTDVALLTELVLADCLSTEVAPKLPQTGDLPGALALAELVVVVSDEV